MLSQYLKGNINFLDEVSSWEESIKVAAKPLLKKGFITDKYIQSMIKNVYDNGPYMVIVPRIAMPHAQDKEGVIKTGISFLKLKKPVLYPEGKEVNISVVLAAEDNSGHLELIADLSSILADEEVRNKFENVESEEELIKIIKTVE
ncbi:transcriptional regulator [Orenia metallireducens]|jgi:PTS system mannitol-specific IIA component/PTS system ascorbate-specific IIA component|uniref:Ascorbate-specific PTS system EIIA component n=1 Tax=Orenia metallireducens TaxID=1413210 RepID=A0A1C0ADK1_9FIRM|nr:PTS sugar transporter subunit IIA [Orenia metallireducens]OCL28770.1 transcriptional regulator [Orenia metallireducens]